MDVPTFVGSDGGSGTRGGEDVRYLPLEHRIIIHHKSSNIGAVSGVGAAPGSAGFTEMVVAGSYGPGGWEVGRGVRFRGAEDRRGEVETGKEMQD